MWPEVSFLSFPCPGWSTSFLPLQDKNKIHWRKYFFSVSLWDKNFLGVARIHTKVQAGNCPATRGFSDHFVYQLKSQSNSSSPELMDTLGSCETSNQGCSNQHPQLCSQSEKIAPLGSSSHFTNERIYLKVTVVYLTSEYSLQIILQKGVTVIMILLQLMNLNIRWVSSRKILRQQVGRPMTLNI